MDFLTLEVLADSKAQSFVALWGKLQEEEVPATWAWIEEFPPHSLGGEPRPVCVWWLQRMVAEGRHPRSVQGGLCFEGGVVGPRRRCLGELE